MLALVDFLLAHEDDAVLDAEAVAQLNNELLPRALAEWPALRGLWVTPALPDGGDREWKLLARSAERLTRERLHALLQQLMLQVGSCLTFFFFFFFWGGVISLYPGLSLK